MPTPYRPRPRGRCAIPDCTRINKAGGSMYCGFHLNRNRYYGHMLQEPVALRDFKTTAELALGVLEDFGDHDAVRSAIDWITQKIEVMPGVDGRAFVRCDRVIREWLASLAPEPTRMLAGMTAVVHREMFSISFVNREAYGFNLIKIAGHFGCGKSTVDRVTSKGRTAQRILVPPRGAAVRLGQAWLDETAPFLLSIARHVDIRRKEQFQRKPKQLAALPMEPPAESSVPPSS